MSEATEGVRGVPAQGAPQPPRPAAQGAVPPGRPRPPEPAPGTEGADLARAALAAARAHARELEQSRAQRSAAGRRAGAQRRSGSRSDDRDPQTLQNTIGRLMAEHGWETPVAVGGVVHNWAEVVGERIAEHCVPVGFAEGVLTLQVDSPAWAVEMRNLAGQLTKRLNEVLPAGPGGAAVRRISVLGPAKPRFGLGGFR